MTLKNATLEGSEWRGCSLTDAVFDGSECGDARFLHCNLANTSWRNAKLGAAAICNGGGGASAIVVERL